MATITSSSQALPSIDLSWHRTSMMWKDHAGGMHADEHESSNFSTLPDLPIEDVLLGRVYLPMESLLVRYIRLPLKQVNMVDKEILFQELADSSDVDAEQWWLTWRLNTCEHGVAGMLFALPEALRESMQAHEQWSQAKEVLVDGYERLQAYVQEGLACLIIDQDDEGMFFGVYDGQAWRGMRRLNGDVEVCWLQLLHSSVAMGFDIQNGVVCGQVDDVLLAKINEANMTWQGELLDTQRTRHEANLNLSQSNEKSVLNLRHGQWALRREWGHLRMWKRSAILASLLLLAWIVGSVVHLQRMDNQIDMYEQQIEAAFHQGLPNEPVMLDALAQLRQAAGGHGIGDTTFLSSLQAVSQVYQTQAWQLKTLELRDGEMHMTGEVKDIKSLNQIQVSLQKVLQKKVSIADTNISGEKVSFRMHW